MDPTMLVAAIEEGGISFILLSVMIVVVFIAFLFTMAR